MYGNVLNPPHKRAWALRIVRKYLDVILQEAELWFMFTAFRYF